MKTITKFSLALLCSAALVACGGGSDDGSKKDETTTQPTGNNTSGNNTSGNNTSGNNTSGNNTSGNNTAGNNTEGNNTEGNNTAGNNTTDSNTANCAAATADLAKGTNTRITSNFSVIAGKTFYPCKASSDSEKIVFDAQGGYVSHQKDGNDMSGSAADAEKLLTDKLTDAKGRLFKSADFYYIEITDRTTSVFVTK